MFLREPSLYHLHSLPCRDQFDFHGVNELLLQKEEVHDLLYIALDRQRCHYICHERKCLFDSLVEQSVDSTLFLDDPMEFAIEHDGNFTTVKLDLPLKFLIVDGCQYAV